MCSSACNAEKDNLLRAVSRKRQKAMCLQIPAPTDWHFDVPDDFAPFLLQNSWKDDKERILIFGDATRKNLLNLSTTWLVDGTFKLSPEIFYQKYTIHVELNGFAPPCVYVLLPNKTEKTYNRKIQLLSEETNPNPGKKLADFEKAALNAFSKKIPHAEILCCYFHRTQSFNRKINEIGLKTYYENFPEFNLALRMLPSLAHVPPAHVRVFFELVIVEKTDVIEREQF